MTAIDWRARATLAERRLRDARRALSEAEDGLLFTADSMTNGGCWCGGNWTGPHHKYCRDQKRRLALIRRAQSSA